MPTGRGWVALGGSAALIVLWVLFGERLMLAAGIFLLLAVAGGVVYVRSIVPSVDVSRRIAPFQVHDGDRAVVDVSISTSRKVTQAVIVDEIPRLGSARFVANRIAPGDPAHARYEVVCHPRGVFPVGPAIVRVRDPFAFTETAGVAGTIDRLVVFPTVEDLDGLPMGRGHDPSVNASRASFAHAGGDDFFTLREYQHGDDLRRVHWPSTARRGELMIRQLELPWQSRSTVLLDPRAGAYPDGDAFEHAVRGAASVLRHLFRNGYAPTLWMGAGSGTVVGTQGAYAAAMEEFAAVRPMPALDLGIAAERLRRSGTVGGVLVLVSGFPDEALIGMFRTLGKDFSRTIVMASGSGAHRETEPFARAGATVMLAAPGERWAGAWHRGMERAWSTATAG